MTIAAQLPKSTLDIRGDRLRFQLANALNECEQQYRNGGVDKATNTLALLAAVTAKLNGLTTISLLNIANISTDNVITAAEAAAGTINVTVGTANFANGSTLTVKYDGATTAGITITTVSSNSATISITSAAAVAMTIGAHALTVSGVDGAGLTKTTVKGFSRTA